MTTQLTDEEITMQRDRMMRSEAYWDPRHIDHEIVKARVTRLFDVDHEGETHGRRPSPIVINSATHEITRL